MTRQIRYSLPPIGNDVDLDLSRNEGRALSVDLLAGLAAQEGLVNRYPNTAPLRSALAGRLGVAEDQVLVTAGADDALLRCFLAFAGPGHTVMSTTPTFEMVPIYANQTRSKLLSVEWWEDPFPAEDLLSVAESADLAIIVSPNNPTGSAISPDQLRAVAQVFPLLILDAAYEEFAGEPLTEAALELGNVIVLRTLSKAWGLAGLRVGYATGPPPLIDALSGFGNPYPVSAVSTAAAVNALQRSETFEFTDTVRQQRETLTAVLADAGVPALPSQANFVLARFEDAEWVISAARALGIGLRRYPDRPGMEHHVRITLPGSEPEFGRLLHALRSAVRPDALLFDMDGVLADVSASQTRAIIAAAAEFGVEVTTDDIAAAKARGDANDDWELARRLCAGRGADVAIEEVARSYEAHYQGAGSVGLKAAETLAVDRQLLDDWSSRFPIGVVTGRPRSDAEEFLQRFDLERLMSVVVTRDDAPLKPDPEPVRLALRQLDVARAWMLGDTPDDLRAAAGAGVVPIGVIAPGDDPSVERRHLEGAAAVLDGIEELEGLLP